MQKIIAQFDKHTGPTAIGTHKLIFEVPKEFAQNMFYTLQLLEKTPSVVMYLELVSSQEEATQITNEDDKAKWTRLNKKIHAMFDEVAELKEVPTARVKDAIKNKLIKKGTIEKSLTELTVEQQIDVVAELENLIVKLKYNE